MRKEGRLQQRRWLPAGALALCLALLLGIFADGFSIVSRADSKGKITVSSAKIRAEASTSSTQLGSAKKDDIVTITGQVQGADGKTWYEVWVNSTTKGYIRSDLLTLVEGDVPETNTPTPATQEPSAPTEVTPVNPVSAEVTGGTSVKIRSEASTNSSILANVSNGLVLTVIGQAKGTDGYTWYQVSFISNESQITGFVRSTFVTLSGEAIPITSDPPASDATPEPATPTEDPATQPDQSEQKEYDTIYAEVGGKTEWRLYTPADGLSWSIAELLEGNVKKVNTQKTIIVILVILLVAAVSAVGYLIFKLKDVMDSAYFNQVESETLRRRSAALSQGGGQRVMHTVGTEKQSARPAGTQGQRPAGSQGQSQRPAGAQSQRPAGAQSQRPAGSQGQSQRPAGSQGQSQRPAGVQGQRPAGSQGQGQRPAGVQGQRPAGSQGQPAQGGAAKPQARDSQQAQGWQSKNFMTDEDDEFEFEFLNVDEGEKK